jgi:hypothetical protein
VIVLELELVLEFSLWAEITKRPFALHGITQQHVLPECQLPPGLPSFRESYASLADRNESGMLGLMKFWLIALFATSGSVGSVFADTLVSGSVYFDSQITLEEVVKFSAARDNESILKLINSGQVSPQTSANEQIVILTTGLTSDSPAEFRFLSGPTTYWTLTKFVTREKDVEPTPTPLPEHSSMPAPTPEASPTPAEKRQRQKSENDDPSDDDNGRRVWHQVNGRWKWRLAHRKPEQTAPPNPQ